MKLMLMAGIWMDKKNGRANVINKRHSYSAFTFWR